QHIYFLVIPNSPELGDLMIAHVKERADLNDGLYDGELSLEDLYCEPNHIVPNVPTSQGRMTNKRLWAAEAITIPLCGQLLDKGDSGSWLQSRGERGFVGIGNITFDDKTFIVGA